MQSRTAVPELATVFEQESKITPVIASGFMRIDDVLKVFPVAKSSWWAGVRSGRYPASVKLAPSTTAWRTADIVALIERIGGQP